MTQRLDKKEFLENAKEALEEENKKQTENKKSLTKKRSLFISLDEEDFLKLQLSASVTTNGNKTKYIKKLIEADYDKNKEGYEKMKEIKKQWK